MHIDQTLLSLLSSRHNHPQHALYNRCSYPLIFFVAVAALAHSTHHQLLRGEILYPTAELWPLSLSFVVASEP